MNKYNVSVGTALLVGLIFIGIQLPNTVSKFKSYDNTVSVKGLCEVEVPADKAIWPVVYKIGGNDLVKVYESIEAQTAIVRNFLRAGGIADEDITVAPPKISDKYTLDYGSSERQFRYVASCTVTVCSKKVSSVLKLMSDQSSLIKSGIAVSSEWDSQPSFNFESLNDVKPGMIEEAMSNAREVAEKIAADSGRSLWKIKDASQGTFSIENRDSNTPSVKKVRIVTYVTYYLK